MKALKEAHSEGRLSEAKRYKAGDNILDVKIDGLHFKIEVFGPFTEIINNKGKCHWLRRKIFKSIRPLVYSVELARSTDLKNNKILFGMINLRSDGKDIYISQMREVNEQ